MDFSFIPVDLMRHITPTKKWCAAWWIFMSMQAEPTRCHCWKRSPIGPSQIWTAYGSETTRNGTHSERICIERTNSLETQNTRVLQKCGITRRIGNCFLTGRTLFHVITGSFLPGGNTNLLR